MSPTKVSFLLLASAVAVAVGPSAVRRIKDAIPEDASAFAGTTNIVFTEHLGADKPDKYIHVSDPEEVRRLVSIVRLVKKRPCACGHMLSADFQTPDANIRVSFCSHCFDVLDPGAPKSHSYQGAKLYHMQRDFYAQLQAYVKQRTNENWHLPPLPKP